MYPTFTAWLYPTEQWDPKSPWAVRIAGLGQRLLRTLDVEGGDTIYGVAMGEPSANFLQAIGIRARLRPLERAAFTAGLLDHKLRGLIMMTSGASGNAATRLESFAVTGSRYVYGSYPEVDGLFAEQVNEQNPRVRKQLLDRAQQIIYDKMVFIPVMGSVFLNGVSSRPEVHGLGLVANYPYSAPYEDLKVRKK